MLYAGGDGKSNDVGIIVNVEISKDVVRVERWQGRIIDVDPPTYGMPQLRPWTLEAERRLSEKRWRGWPV